MKLAKHPANKDSRAVCVWTKPNNGMIQSVYNTSGGFVAAIGHGECLPDYFKTKEDAIRALESAVVRFVVTHINKDGIRTLAHAQQGRCTYETAEQAQGWIDSARANNSAQQLAGVYPHPESLEVRPVECWPVHFDPKCVWFD